MKKILEFFKELFGPKKSIVKMIKESEENMEEKDKTKLRIIK